MSLGSVQRRQLKSFIRNLEPYRGRHTELVSVYVPAGYEITKIIGHLSQEQGTASNIKSSSTRKNVQDALERMIQHLKIYNKTPPHGLACFSGNVAEREGQSDVQVWSIEPPVPLKTRLYRCDKTFQLELLQEMIEIKESYGLVVMDRREANIAMLKGKAIVPLVVASSNVPGKTRAGGQSAARYMRLREDAAKEFYKKIGDMMKDQFFQKENLKGIIVGGPGPTKYDFVDGGFITADVKKKIIAIKDLSYTGDFGIQELVDRSEDVLAKEEIAVEKKILERFFTTLATKQEMVSYGQEETMKALKMGAVDILLVSESLSDDVINTFEEESQKVGSEIRLISTDTREGAQLHELGKVGAILRYPLSR